MTPHERAVKVVNDWYENKDANRTELVQAVTNAIMANNNLELEGHRKRITDLQDRLEQSNAHRKLLVAGHKEIQDRLSVVATGRQKLAHTCKEALSANYYLSKLVNEIFGLVSGGAYQGSDYSGVVASIKAKILVFNAKGVPVNVDQHRHQTPDHIHHNQD